MTMTQTLLAALGLMLAIGMIAFAFAGPSAKKAAERRMNSLRIRHSDNAVVRVEAQMRRAIANRQPRINANGEDANQIQMLARRLQMTGKDWTLKQFFTAVAGIAVIVAVALFFRTGSLLLSLFAGTGIGFAIPHYIVGRAIKRRANKFISTFPDAIELLVRGLRSGLPVTETLQVVSKEVPGPVGEEFKLITERIKIGRTMDDALTETAMRLNLAEFNFFCITLAIQRETGGNLAETLSNLSNVLRQRAQMKLKIRALSSESKASAYIVGSLPFLVFGMVYWVNPNYLAGFFSDQRLIVAGLGGMVWMSIGAFIMAKMVNFEI